MTELFKQPSGQRGENGFFNRGREVTRTEAFVDAAFAFAVTLLVISIDAIPDTAEKLMDALKSVPAFGASFMLIALFWRGHAEWSRRYGLDDRQSQRLSLLLVFLVLVFVYPLRMVFAAFFSWISDGWLPANLVFSSNADIRLMFVVFAIAFGSLGGVMLALYYRAYGLREQLRLDKVELLASRHSMVRWGMVVLFSLLSLLLSWLIPLDTESNLWASMPVLIFFLLNFLQMVMTWRTRRAIARQLAKGNP